MTDRALGYCATRALCGRKIADELCGRKLSAGFDMDQPGDEEMVAAIVREEAQCEACLDLEMCEQ